MARTMRIVLATIAIALCSMGQSLSAETPEAAIIGQFATCRTITDDAARLKCLDSAANALRDAVAAKQLYVVERKQVRDSRRALFGFSFPRLGILGGDEEDGNQVTQLDTQIQGASTTRDGNWLIAAADGSVWEQTDGRTLGRVPTRGTPIIIRRAALGSYKMNVGTQPAIRVKRTK